MSSESNTSQPLDKAPQPMPVKDWTVAIDLAESGLPDKANPKGAGVDRQLPALKLLAGETADKSVSFVVHVQRTVDDQLKPCDQGQSDVEKKSACVLNAQDHKAAMIERFYIHDGKIEKLADAHYKDAAQDLTALVKEAGQLAPSKHLGLIIDSHGAGSEGIGTNLGPLSLDQTTSAIKIGLLSSDHEKLDLLDYDACDMAALKVIDASVQVSNDVVASSAMEGVTYTNDSQNVKAAMQALLANSKMTGRELGDTIVRQAASGANGTGDNNATQTLANFDLTMYQSFKQDLDLFGKALSNAAKKPDNLQQLQADIDKTPMPDTGKSEPQSHDRDLKAFAQNILADSQAHKFSGDTRPLEASAKSLLQSFQPLVTAQFGSQQKGYDKLGGLTVSMPGSEILDSKRVAREVTPLHEMSNQLKEVLGTNPPLSYKSRVTQYLADKISELPPELLRQYPNQTMAMLAAQAAIENAKDLKSYTTAVRHMHEVADKIDSGPMGVQVAGAMTRKAADEQLNYLNAPLAQVTPQWDNFVELMQEQAK